MLSRPMGVCMTGVGARVGVRRFASSASGGKPHIVVLGTGWAGYPFLKALKKDVRSEFDISLVSPSTTFSFTPLLAQAACGTLDFRSVIEPVHSDRQVQFHHGWCEGVDLQRQVLEIQPSLAPEFNVLDPLLPPTSRSAQTQTAGAQTYTVPYDLLVVSIGSYNATFGTKGVKDNALFLKSASDARAIRWRIYHCFDTANRILRSSSDATSAESVQRVKNMLTFVVVGGGPTGAEFAAELHDLVKQDLSRVYPQLKGYASFKLLDAGTKILSSFDKTLSDYAMTKFSRDGIDVRLSQKIRAVQPDGIVLENDAKQEEKIPAGMVVWSTGITTSPLVDALHGVAKDSKSGKLVVNDHLQLLTDSDSESAQSSASGGGGTVIPNVFALGDCAVQKSGASPATAQVASQQGVYLASLLNKRFITSTSLPSLASTATDGGGAKSSLPIFKWSNKGSMTSIGSSEALIDSPNPVVGKESGKLAWIAWKAAYTFMNMTTRNKFLVPANWVSNWVFGRDVGRV